MEDEKNMLKIIVFIKSRIFQIVLAITIGVVVSLLFLRQTFLVKKIAPSTKASDNRVVLTWLPTTITKKIGETTTLSVLIDTKQYTVSAVELVLRYDPLKLELKPENIVHNNSVNFLPDLLANNTKIENGKVTIILLCSAGTPKKGAGSLVSFNFKALTAGTTNITFDESTIVAAIEEPNQNVFGPVSSSFVTIESIVVPTITPIPTVTPTPTRILTSTPTPTIIPTRTPTVNLTATPTPTIPIYTPTPTATSTPTPTTSLQSSVILNLKLKFQGIVKKPINNSMKVKVAFIDNSGTKKEAFGDFVADDNGIWSGTTTIGNTVIDQTKKYSLLIKGPRHVQKKVCDILPAESSFGAYRCSLSNISLLSGSNTFNFSNILLLTGDLPPQDGVVNSYDLSFIRNNLHKETADSLQKADLNQDGRIDVQDWSLIIASLSIKLDDE